MSTADHPTSSATVRWTEIFEGIEPDAFEELAHLAGQVSEAPIAMVTLVDEDRRWFTSLIGAQLAVGAWEQTFCAHAVCQTNVFVVPDAARDPRFAANPLVAFPPHVRFYAGAPLIAGGAVVGTLCVMDRRPRELPPASSISLRALARQVVMQLELRRQARQLEVFNEALETEVLERRRTESRLRSSEDALLASQERLKETDRERRELVANFSHDLRTPLTSLQGYLDAVLIKDDTLDAATRRQYLEQASTQSRRLADRIADLFELAQLDDSRFQLKPEPFGLAELAHDVVQVFGLEAEAKGIVLRFRVEDPRATVNADVRLIERVIENLLNNAIRFTPVGGTVTVTCGRAESGVVLTVSDTGPGFAAADHQRIFGRFYSGRQPVERTANTVGLGLAIAHRIIELHGGATGAESMSQGGARVTFSLPPWERPMPV